MYVRVCIERERERVFVCVDTISADDRHGGGAFKQDAVMFFCVLCVCYSVKRDLL